MPPRRRRPNEPAPPASPSPVPEPSPPDSNASSASPSANTSHDDLDSPRFFNTTYTTYRASPLYIGERALNPARLQVLARHLRDALVGDVVRGVQVGLEGDTTLGRIGTLYAVEWRWVKPEQILGSGASNQREGSVELGNDSDEQAENRRQHVLCIELRYENARFNALLLPDLARDEKSPGSTNQPSWTWQADSAASSNLDKVDQASFLHLPLLLFRMPAPLKSVLIDFLSNTFDCRISPLALGSRTLVKSWEAWLSEGRRHPPSKDVLITLGFHIEPAEPKPKRPEDDEGGVESEGQKLEPPQLGLKTIDVTIPTVDVQRFLHVGENLVGEHEIASIRKRKAGSSTTLSGEQQSRRRRKLAGGRDEEGWAWRRPDHEAEDHPEKISQPFTEALAAYVWHHLGLDMFHPGVRVQRVACDGFALSEGRLKVFAPSGGRRSDDGEESSAWRLMSGLVRRARGRPVGGPE